MKSVRFSGTSVISIEIPDGFDVVSRGGIKPGDLIWNCEEFIPAKEDRIGKNVRDFICVIRKETELTKYRYVLDVRNCIAAVCDTQHQSYAEKNPRLSADNKYIVAVERGISKSTFHGLSWVLEDYQIDRLTKLCDLLNKKGGQ